MATTHKLLMTGWLALLLTGTAAGHAHAGVFTPEASLTLDTVSAVKGGLTHHTRVMSNLDLTMAWQGNNGWEAFGYVLVNSGGGFSEMDAGDSQVVSNIDSPDGTRLFEAWVKKTSADQTLSLTAGAINLNGTFDVQDVGGVFLNSSHGIGAEYAQIGPSIFPYSALGTVIDYSPSDTTRLSFGLFDAVAGDPDDPDAFAAFDLDEDEGLHMVAELTTTVGPATLKLGGWANTVEALRHDGVGEGRVQGAYVHLAAPLTTEPDDEAQGWSGWIRLGAANGEVLPLSSYIGGGLVRTGGLPGRDHDSFGVAIAHARFGDDWRALNPGLSDAETTVEVTYQAEIRPGVILQPDLQWVKNPSGDATADDAIVVGLRLRLTPDAFNH